MIDTKVLALVVVDSENIPLCLLSMMDLVHFFTNYFTESDFGDGDVQSLIQKKAEITNVKISDIQEIAQLDRPYSVPETARVIEAAQLMVEKNAHRVLVYDSKSKLCNLVTQSRIIQLFESVLDHIPQKAHFTIQELELVKNRKVVSINENETSFKAFKRMKEEKVSGIAVVNNEGVLVGTMSISDLRVLGYDLSYFYLLSKPVKAYVDVVKQRQKFEEDRPYVICTKPSDPIGDVIRTVSFWKVHRIFVVDDNRKPIDVISLREIIAAMISLHTPLETGLVTHYSKTK